MDREGKKRLYKRLKAELDMETDAIRCLGKLEIELLDVVDKIDGDIWLYKSDNVMSCILPGYPSSLIPKCNNKVS